MCKRTSTFKSTKLFQTVLVAIHLIHFDLNTGLHRYVWWPKRGWGTKRRMQRQQHKRTTDKNTEETQKTKTKTKRHKQVKQLVKKKKKKKKTKEQKKSGEGQEANTKQRTEDKDFLLHPEI